MSNEPNLAELAVATWRLERWLNNLDAERKMAAESSIRIIKKYLKASGIETEDPFGLEFDPGLAVEVIGSEAKEKTENLKIIETITPIIKKNGAVIQFGRIVIGTDVNRENSGKVTKVQLLPESMSDYGTTKYETHLQRVSADREHNIWTIICPVRERKDHAKAELIFSTGVPTSIKMYVDDKKHEKQEYMRKQGKFSIPLTEFGVWHLEIRPKNGQISDNNAIAVWLGWKKSVNKQGGR